MKPILTVVVSVLLLAALPVITPAASPTQDITIVGVDYVLALMDQGIDQKEIVQRIQEKDLFFRLVPGNISRLRSAGAGQELINEVRARAAGPDAGAWEHPRRLDDQGSPEGEKTTPAPSYKLDETGEGIEEEPYGTSSYGGTGYYPGPSYSFGFSYGYPYPYYYYPYSYYYPSYYYPYYPYYSHYGHSYYGHSYNAVPRGGHYSGGHYSGGGAPHAAPRSGGGSRPAPRGSHH